MVQSSSAPALLTLNPKPETLNPKPFEGVLPRLQPSSTYGFVRGTQCRPFVVFLLLGSMGSGNLNPKP